MKRLRTTHGALALLSLGVAFVSGCSTECKEGAHAKDGLCLPTCPAVTCGDNVCTQYVWSDGQWDDSLRCETPASCARDCSNADLNVAQALYFMSAKIDSDLLPNPADNDSGSGSCSGGGQVSASGSLYCLNALGVCTHDVTYSFSDCVYKVAYPDATLSLASGSVRISASYANTDDAVRVYQVSGQVNLGGTVPVGAIGSQTAQKLAAQDCALDYTLTFGPQQSVTAGSICGRVISNPVYSP